MVPEGGPLPVTNRSRVSVVAVFSGPLDEVTLGINSFQVSEPAAGATITDVKKVSCTLATLTRWYKSWLPHCSDPQLPAGRSLQLPLCTGTSECSVLGSDR